MTAFLEFQEETGYTFPYPRYLDNIPQKKVDFNNGLKVKNIFLK